MNTEEERNNEEKQALEDRLIQAEYDHLQESYLNSNHRGKTDIIERAFKFAKEAHKDVRRRSGEPYIMHPLAVARIVCEDIGLGSTSICAALLHDVVEDVEEITVVEIKQSFGEKIAEIVDGLTKISGGQFGEKASEQALYIQKLILTMNSDIRVILVKMADRLHNMRTLGSMPTDKQYKIASETLYLYAPLAERLGLLSIKTELEDLGLKYEHPDEFEFINNKLEASEESRQRLFKDFAKPIDDKLHEMKLVYKMRARVKSIYSIWKKMQDEHITFEEIYDIYAVRIIFESQKKGYDKTECWTVLQAVSEIYDPCPNRLRDYINHPKPNGYQALHTTVLWQQPHGQMVDIQIQSKRMYEIAEKGYAARKYKGASAEDIELDKWLQTFNEILQNPNPDLIDLMGTIKMNLFSSVINVFTPKRKIIKLPQGATVLDFAYELHTDIGNHSISANVNHHSAPLNLKLSGGDQVEILTSNTQNPVSEWLTFVTTVKARTKIEEYLKRTRKETAKKGEEKLLKAFRKAKIEPITSLIDKVALYSHFTKREDFYYAIEKEGRTLSNKDIKEALRSKVTPPKPGGGEPDTPEPPIINRKKPYILSKGNHTIAECCKPIPGDDAFGHIQDDGTVVVHKRSCERAMLLNCVHGNRILTTVWSDSDSVFEATLEIEGIDAVGVLNAITKTISEDFNINIKRLLIETFGGIFKGNIKILVHNVEDVSKIRATLSKLENVKYVVRIED
ncbi:MAG: RelA/SpoT family protein [Tannerella sp.]|jgi:GTP pyrophosphokinase|nr:RelA/SpoT family protein [Tannerella sp.]